MNKISVELKAVTKLEDVNLAQAMNYLEVYNLEIGLLINSEVEDWNFIALPTKNLIHCLFHIPLNPQNPTNPSSDK